MWLLRWISLGALGYGLYEVARTSPDDLRGGDLAHAFWLVVCVVCGLAAALLWVPVFGDRLLGSPGEATTDASMVDPPGRLLALIRRLDARRYRRLVRWLCFWEGVRHPWRPAPFFIGMNNSAPGSWLERVYAREVYRFTNVDNCVRAWQVLSRHGRVPEAHPRDEVNRRVRALGTERGEG